LIIERQKTSTVKGTLRSESFDEAFWLKKPVDEDEETNNDLLQNPFTDSIGKRRNIIVFIHWNARQI